MCGADIARIAQFVVSDSAGVSLAEVQQGAAWPAALTSAVSRERYAALLKDQRVSFNAGPCEYARYIYGGGAEWRGVERDQAREKTHMLSRAAAQASPARSGAPCWHARVLRCTQHACSRVFLRDTAPLRTCMPKS